MLQDRNLCYGPSPVTATSTPTHSLITSSTPPMSPSHLPPLLSPPSHGNFNYNNNYGCNSDPNLSTDSNDLPGSPIRYTHFYLPSESLGRLCVGVCENELTFIRGSSQPHLLAFRSFAQEDNLSYAILNAILVNFWA